MDNFYQNDKSDMSDVDIIQTVKNWTTEKIFSSNAKFKIPEYAYSTSINHFCSYICHDDDNLEVVKFIIENFGYKMNKINNLDISLINSLLNNTEEISKYLLKYALIYISISPYNLIRHIIEWERFHLYYYLKLINEEYVEQSIKVLKDDEDFKLWTKLVDNEDTIKFLIYNGFERLLKNNITYQNIIQIQNIRNKIIHNTLASFDLYDKNVISLINHFT